MTEEFEQALSPFGPVIIVASSKIYPGWEVEGVYVGNCSLNVEIHSVDHLTGTKTSIGKKPITHCVFRDNNGTLLAFSSGKIRSLAKHERRYYHLTYRGVKNVVANGRNYPFHDWDVEDRI